MKESEEDQREHPPAQPSSGSSQHSRPAASHTQLRDGERSRARWPSGPSPGSPTPKPVSQSQRPWVPLWGRFTAGFWSPQTGVHLRAPCSCLVSVESGRRAVHPCAGEAVTEPRKPVAQTPGASLAALGPEVLLTALVGCPPAVLREGPPQDPSVADGPWAPPTPAALPAVLCSCPNVPCHKDSPHIG